MSKHSSTSSVISRPEYGDPFYNFGCAAKLKSIFRSFTASENCITETHEAHNEAVEMILTKIARVATGKRKADNYDDIIGYATLAKQLANLEKDGD